MNFKEKFIKEFKRSQIKFVSFDRSFIGDWDEEINRFDEISLQFISDTIFYDLEYFEIDFEASIVCLVKEENEICALKLYAGKNNAIYAQVYFGNAFDINLGKRVIKCIMSVFQSGKFKVKSLRMPYSNTLINLYTIQLSFFDKIKPSIEMYVDLSKSKEELWKNIRKSYKSLINKGEREFEIQSKFNSEIWEKCKLFHLRVAGKKTRSDQTWEIQKNLIEKGKAKLLYIIDDDELLGFTLITLGKTICSYSIGVYDRNKFSKLSISHILIWNAILYLRNSNFKLLHLGTYSPEEHLNDQKLYNINQFKMGFSNHLINNQYI